MPEPFQIEEHYERLTEKIGHLELSVKPAVHWLFEDLEPYTMMKMDKNNKYHNSCGNNNCRYKFELGQSDCKFFLVPRKAFSEKALKEIEDIYKNLEHIKTLQRLSAEYNLCVKELFESKALYKLNNFLNAVQEKSKVDINQGQLTQDGVLFKSN